MKTPSKKTKNEPAKPAATPGGSSAKKIVEAQEAMDLQAKGWTVVGMYKGDKGRKVYELVPPKKD